MIVTGVIEQFVQNKLVADVAAAATLADDSTPAALAERRAALAAQLALVEAQLQAQIEAERAEMIRGIRETMAAHGITVEDLRTKSEAKRVAVQRKPKAEKAPAEAIEYAEPGTGKRWTSGKPGQPPRWVKEAKKAGTLDSLRVQ